MLTGGIFQQGTQGGHRALRTLRKRHSRVSGVSVVCQCDLNWLVVHSFHNCLTSTCTVLDSETGLGDTAETNTSYRWGCTKPKPQAWAGTPLVGSKGTIRKGTETQVPMRPPWRPVTPASVSAQLCPSCSVLADWGLLDEAGWRTTWHLTERAWRSFKSLANFLVVIGQIPSLEPLHLFSPKVSKMARLLSSSSNWLYRLEIDRRGDVCIEGTAQSTWNWDLGPISQGWHVLQGPHNCSIKLNDSSFHLH